MFCVPVHYVNVVCIRSDVGGERGLKRTRVKAAAAAAAEALTRGVCLSVREWYRRPNTRVCVNDTDDQISLCVCGGQDDPV